MSDGRPEQQEQDRRAWWRARRLRYNVALVVAGVAAFFSYAAIVWTAPAGALGDAPEGPEITAFTTLFQAVGYLMAMAIANVCYGLGALGERVLQPRDVSRFRRVAYTAGLCFSVASPFTIPLLVGLKVLTAR
jgi:hypothetical protein